MDKPVIENDFSQIFEEPESPFFWQAGHLNQGLQFLSDAFNVTGSNSA